MILAWMTLLSAISISSVAAWYSIFGLLKIFPQYELAIILLGTVIEVGKVVSVLWVHQNWRNVKANILKPYMISAIVVAMIVTSIGIYGFLSKSHLDQQAKGYQPTKDLVQIDSKLSIVNEKLARANTSFNDLDSAFQQYVARGYVTKALTAREKLQREKKELSKTINSLEDEKGKLEAAKQEVQLEVKKIELDYGPIKYVADLFGYSDLESAVRLLILMIMFVFDPLALCLLIASQISFDNARYPQTNDQQHYYKDVNDFLGQRAEYHDKAKNVNVGTYGKKKDKWFRRLLTGSL